MSTINYTNTAPLQLPKFANGKPISKEVVKEEPIRYCLYARKSSEDDERQALSVDSQIKEMLEQAQREDLLVVDIRKESHSAKQSNQRPVFNQLLLDIAQRKFNGILSWAPDRLSRNAGDLGSVVDLMDQELLKDIRTHGQRFSNSPNEKFLLMILCSQAKLENDHRGENVKRGMKAKCEMGYRPSKSPLGYLPDLTSPRGMRSIILDPERAPIIKQMFEKVYFNGWSGREIFQWLNEIGFSTRSGKKITLSSVYRTLNNPYYCGVYEYPKGSGTWYTANHPAIISKQLFEDVQERLAVVPKSSPGTIEYNFTKLLKCGYCGSGVTAERKIKKFKNGTSRVYIYYHCTQARNIICKNPYIKEEELLNQLLNIIDTIPIEKIEAQQRIQHELFRYHNFTQGVLNSTVSKEMVLPQIDAREFARYILKNGTKEEKRELLSCVNAKLILNDRKIHLE
ncbi:MAG: Recombinase [bacterium ADurb.Bin212]|nr:MAG: Recombinase [bacterium ADurb.Bin212]